MQRAAIALLALLLATSLAHARGELSLLRVPDARGQLLDLQRLKGQVVVVTFASRFTQGQAARLNERLASRLKLAKALVVSVVDFEGIPEAFHAYARKKVVESNQPGRIEQVIDVAGKLRGAFATDPRNRIDIIVLDREGTQRGHFVGDAGADQTLELVAQLDRAAL